MSIRHLLSMLAPKTQSLRRGSRSADVLSPQDVAAAAAGSERLGYYICLVKFSQHEHLTNNILEELCQSIRSQALERRWDVRRADLDAICMLAVLEALQDHLCRHCRGAGKHKNQRTCKACRGSGRVTMDDEDRRKACDMGKRDWERAGRRAFAAAVRLLQAEEDAFLGHMARRL